MQGLRQGFAAHRYRGDDRRGPGSGPSPDARFPLVGLVVLGSVAVWVETLADTSFAFDSVELADVGTGMALVLSLCLGALCYMRWNVAGRSRALWLAAAVWTLGVVVIGLGEVAPLSGLGRAGMVWEHLHRAGFLVTGLLMVQALRTPEVDTRLSAGRVGGLAAAGVAVLTVLLQMSEGLWTLADPSRAWLEVAWLALAGAYLVIGLLRRRPMLAGFGLVALGLVLAESTAGSWSAARPLLLGLALLFGLVGTGREVAHAFRSQSSRVLQSLVHIHSAEARVEAQRAVREEVAHQARSALLAIQGATQTLEQHRDRLDEGERRDLEAAVEVEIGRLRNLVAPSPAVTTARFALAEVLAPLVAVQRLYGVQVTSLVPADLVMQGDPAILAEVVQSLLENARQHASGAPVDVRAQRDGDLLVLRVEDRGPGVEPSQAAHIFQRGVRGERSGGSGLGLFIARRLADDLGGRLWLEDRAGGGASFCLALPLASADDSGQDAVQQLDQIGEPSETDDLTPLGRLDRSQAGGTRVLGEADDDVGG